MRALQVRGDGDDRSQLDGAPINKVYPTRFTQVRRLQTRDWLFGKADALRQDDRTTVSIP